MAIKEETEIGVEREPLMRRINVVSEEAGYDKHGKGSEFMVYFSTFVAVCGSFEFGSCIGYSSPIQDALIKDMSLSLSEFSVFGSILTFGAMIGAITSGRIADLIGRRGTMRVSAVFCVAGWLAIYFAKGALALDIGRLATGYGMGVFSYVVPVFIAEIAPKNLRGALTAVNQLMIGCGVSVAYIIGTVLSWRTLALTGLVPCAILLIGLFLIPESPRWLAKTGRAEEFEAALQKLHGKDADISHEAAEIRECIELLDSLPKAKLLDLFQRRYLSSTIIAVGLMVFQQFGGINGVCFYLSNIFEQVGFSTTIGTIAVAIIPVVVTALNTIVIDKVGRKPLLLVSASGLVIACIATATSFYLKVNEVAAIAVPTLAVIGILLYIGSFAVGMAAVPWVIMSEIFPINIKGAGGSLATFTNWFGAWVISYTFNFLMSWSSYGTFALYGAINVMATVFVVKVVPETKGKTLEQIQVDIDA